MDSGRIVLGMALLKQNKIYHECMNMFYYRLYPHKKNEKFLKTSTNYSQYQDILFDFFIMIEQ